MRFVPPLLIAALGAALLACSPLEPDPVIRDGVDIGPIQSFEAERAQVSSGMGNIWDSSASDNHALALYSNVTAAVPLELLIDVSGLVVRARGDQCQGGPELELLVDGVERLKTEVTATHWTDYPALVHLGAGMHKFEFRFANDKYDGPKCDRNLYVDKVTFINERSVPKDVLPAVAMLAPSGTQIVDDPRVPGKKALGFMSEAVATGQLETGAAAGLSIRARGDQCKGPPEITLTVDGVPRGWFKVPNTQWADFAAPVPLSAGDHTISVAFINDKFEGCDRNAYVADIKALPVAPAPVPVAPPAAPDGGAVPPPPPAPKPPAAQPVAVAPSPKPALPEPRTHGR